MGTHVGRVVQRGRLIKPARERVTIPAVMGSREWDRDERAGINRAVRMWFEADRERDVKWVTSKGIKISRAAAVWAIRRFIDADAEIVFVPTGEVAAVAEREGGVGFHAAGTAYPPIGPNDQSSFEALVAAYRPDDAVLQELARMVGHADRPGRADAPPEAAGVRLISGAFPLVARDDIDTVERSQFMYDALYAALEQRQRSRLTK